ncbi:hypothetical protein J3R30DRAFT_624425 [Lentinula aciculospora]|uniref:Uncharacterized protein n=1 Tax=Lentinula aciculospora TaxID=153920 RepID=A0A9W9A5H6_9AGAR|nr:hypothetical protein J3R30DRAFT_624425 [Lentinula aciculospora]
MSLHNASLDRRFGHIRRAGAAAAADGNDDSSDNNGNNTGNGNSNSNGNGSSQVSSSATASSTAAADTTTAITTSANTQPTSQSVNVASTSQSSSTSASAAVAQVPSSSSSSSVVATVAASPSVTSSSTALSTSSPASSSTISSITQSSTPASTSTSTHISTVTPTAALVTGVQASSFASVSHVSATSSVSAASSTSSAKVTGAINTGAVVGGIAGGLAGVAILGFLLAFFLRRYNRKKRAARFEASQFRSSAMVLDDEPRYRPRPPEMVQNRENNYINSVTSTTGPGMAGAGAYRFQEEHQDVNQSRGHGASFDTEHEYYRDQAGQQYYDEAPPVPAVPMQRAPLQARQQYTFGQAPAGSAQASGNANPFVVDNYDGEYAAYGSQPHDGGHYDSQAYGNYAAYSPQQTNHVAGAHPSGQQVSRTSIIDESDVYGGI